jgi:hypothetical protein
MRQLEDAIDRRSIACATPEPYDNSYYPGYYGSYYSPFYYRRFTTTRSTGTTHHHHYPHVTPHSASRSSAPTRATTCTPTSHIGGALVTSWAAMGSHAPVGNFANFGRMTGAPMRR